MRKQIQLLFLTFLLLVPPPLPAQENLSRKQRVLIAEQIEEYEEPIHEQSRPWLIDHFGPGKVYPINLTRATKNILWQVHEQIRKGERPSIDGIIRTFWYTHIKPVFARTDSLNSQVDQSELLSEVLVELVRDRGLMRYKDFGFFDQNAGNRRLGKNLNLVLVGEKHGKFTVLEKIAQELDCTFLTLGGQPSLLSMEYLVDEYKARGFDLRHNLRLIFVVDYDPAGKIIRDSVVRDLNFYGMKNLTPIDIITPAIFTKEELELVKFPLPPNQKTLNEKWLKKTGGVNGQPYGVESDSLPFPKLKQLILAVAKTSGAPK